ncbi:hypothetical protein F4780DRAFT_46972 [Xylariomycetidae sp. FL0641]|nr:hypothetical protein F4780DRAFT_46972 [Xylariomycetidae sp. FL0641]
MDFHPLRRHQANRHQVSSPIRLGLPPQGPKDHAREWLRRLRAGVKARMVHIRKRASRRDNRNSSRPGRIQVISSPVLESSNRPIEIGTQRYEGFRTARQPASPPGLPDGFLRHPRPKKRQSVLGVLNFGCREGDRVSDDASRNRFRHRDEEQRREEPHRELYVPTHAAEDFTWNSMPRPPRRAVACNPVEVRESADFQDLNLWLEEEMSRSEESSSVYSQPSMLAPLSGAGELDEVQKTRRILESSDTLTPPPLATPSSRARDLSRSPSTNDFAAFKRFLQDAIESDPVLHDQLWQSIARGLSSSKARMAEADDDDGNGDDERAASSRRCTTGRERRQSWAGGGAHHQSTRTHNHRHRQPLDFASLDPEYVALLRSDTPGPDHHRLSGGGYSEIAWTTPRQSYRASLDIAALGDEHSSSSRLLAEQLQRKSWVSQLPGLSLEVARQAIVDYIKPPKPAAYHLPPAYGAPAASHYRPVGRC